MFIFWSDHKNTAIGNAAKYVRCEQCSAEFGYILHREFTGHAMSLFFLDESGAASRARNRAERGLRRALAHGVDPHFCPKCDHLQQNMVREAKRRYFGWMSVGNVIFALVLPVPGAFVLSLLIINALSGQEFLIPFPIFYGFWAGIVIVVLLMPLIRPIVAALYDPQRLTSEQRLQKGIYSGTLLEDWEAVQEKTEAKLRELGITTLPARHPRPGPRLEGDAADEQEAQR